MFLRDAVNATVISNNSGELFIVGQYAIKDDPKTKEKDFRAGTYISKLTISTNKVKEIGVYEFSENQKKALNVESSEGLKSSVYHQLMTFCKPGILVLILLVKLRWSVKFSMIK
ncbi:MAG: hypothetical protein R2850_04825 [Bacteroidia bacterium]